MSKTPVGAKREDGYRFYTRKKDGRELWLSPSAFHRQRVAAALRHARHRAFASDLQFDLTVEGLLAAYPADGLCPVLRVPMEWGGDRRSSPSLDRTVPQLGYTLANVRWISDRANSLKSDASSAELFAVANYVRNHELR